MMELYLRSNLNYYDIPYTAQDTGAHKTLIICHGFGSSKESPTVQLLRRSMANLGVDTFSFDFPAHGVSPVDGTHLRVATCLADLGAMEAEVLRRNPHTELVYFGSSFGAYITLLYLAKCPHRGKRAFLRSAAIEMHEILQRFFQNDGLVWQADLNGDSSQDICNFVEGYQKPFFIQRAFVEELQSNSIQSLYPNDKVDDLTLVHGEVDSVAPLADVKRFAARTGATLHILPGAEHQLLEAGMTEAFLAYLFEWI